MQCGTEEVADIWTSAPSSQDSVLLSATGTFGALGTSSILSGLLRVSKWHWLLKGAFSAEGQERNQGTCMGPIYL